MPSVDKVLPGNNLWQSQWGKTLCQSLVQTRFCLEATPLAEPMGQDLVPKPGADQVLPEPMGQELAHVLCSPGGIMSSFGTAKRGRPKTLGFPGKCLVNVLKV